MEIEQLELNSSNELSEERLESFAKTDKVDPTQHISPIYHNVDTQEPTLVDKYDNLTSAQIPERKIRELPRSHKKIVSNFERVEVIQEFEGIVDFINSQEGTFIARLIDLTAKEEFARDEGEFPIDDIRKDDLPLLQEGAIFRVRIAYNVKRGGTRQRFTEIIFRRLPAWQQRHFDIAEQNAEQLASFFDGE
jgi:hypothetical protein